MKDEKRNVASGSLVALFYKSKATFTSRRVGVAIWLVKGCSGASTMYVTPINVSGLVVNTSTFSAVPSSSNVMLATAAWKDR